MSPTFCCRVCVGSVMLMLWSRKAAPSVMTCFGGDLRIHPVWFCFLRILFGLTRALPAHVPPQICDYKREKMALLTSFIPINNEGHKQGLGRHAWLSNAGRVSGHPRLKPRLRLDLYRWLGNARAQQSWR